MSNRATKVLFALVGLVLVGILVFFYTSFNGNPIKVYLTRGRIKNYLETTYPTIEFSEVTSQYNFKTGGYGGRALAHTEPQVKFYINQSQTKGFSDNLVELKIEAHAKAETTPLIEAMFPDKTFSVMLKLDNDSLGYPITQDFSKDLPLELLVDVRWSGPVITKEEFVDQVLEIHEGLESLDYNLSGHFYDYSLPTEPERYLLSLKGGEGIMSREALLADVYHMTK